MSQDEAVAEFLGALATKCNELTGGEHNAFYNSVGGRVYFGIVPSDKAYPYVQISIIDALPRFTFGEKKEDILVEAAIYSATSDPTEALGIMAAWRALYEGKRDLVTTNWYETSFLPSPGLLRMVTVNEIAGHEGGWTLNYQDRARLELK